MCLSTCGASAYAATDCTDAARKRQKPICEHCCFGALGIPPNFARSWGTGAVYEHAITQNTTQGKRMAMYQYRFELTPAHPHSKIDYTSESIQQKLRDAAQTVNRGYTFRTDGKVIEITEIEPQKIALTLMCRTALRHSARSLSALTRYLSPLEEFQGEIYNRTLFCMNFLSQTSSFDGDIEGISDADLLKGVVDLLFSSTTATKAEADFRMETIRSMKKMIRPFCAKGD